MPDFKALLGKSMTDVKRPPVIPAGTYSGNIKGYKIEESSKKKTPFVGFTVRLMAPGDDIESSDLTDPEGNPIQISGKEMSRNGCDFYLTPDSEWRLKEFLASLGIEENKTFGEALPETTNAEVIVTVGHQTNQNDPNAPPYAVVNKLTGTVGAGA